MAHPATQKPQRGTARLASQQLGQNLLLEQIEGVRIAKEPRDADEQIAIQRVELVAFRPQTRQVLVDVL